MYTRPQSQDELYIFFLKYDKYVGGIYSKMLNSSLRL